MILVISVCREKLHENEFVDPITDYLDFEAIPYLQKHYSHVTDYDLQNCSKIIICGTSLQDNDYLEHLDAFNWMLYFGKPLLGICAGMQIIGLVHGGKIKKKLEIGYFFEEFTKPFLGLFGKEEVYHLHSRYIDFTKLLSFKIYTKGKVSQAVKHMKKPLYGVLFHPEVRNKKLIKKFVLL